MAQKDIRFWRTHGRLYLIPVFGVFAKLELSGESIRIISNGICRHLSVQMKNLNCHMTFAFACTPVIPIFFSTSPNAHIVREFPQQI
jgi:hypothetical protein